MLLTPAENCCIIYSPILNSNINIQGQYSILLLTPAQKCRIIYFQYSRSIFNIYCYWHPLKTAVSSTFNIDLESQYSRSIFIILYCFWHPFKIVVTSSSNIQGRYSILLLKPAQNCRIIYMLSILKVNLNVKLVWSMKISISKKTFTPITFNYSMH